MSALPLLFGVIISALAAYFFFPLGIKFARRLKILDYPSARKRHTNPIPIIGGVSIFFAWTIGMVCTSLISSKWGFEQSKSFTIVAVSIWALIGLGLWDDVKGISPRIKLVIQFAIACITVQFEPNLHAVCLLKGAGLSTGLYAILIFVPAVVWLVGVMNAINLIDGIDGFAGGASLLITISTLALNFFPGNGNYFGITSLAILVVPLAVFQKYNWAPAKIFLGDNGSFSLGYLLALNVLIHRPNPNLLVGIPCLFIVFAYPILDMGLCVFRRFRNGYPLFKADRSHLHHRIQRLGLSTSQTTGFLLCIVAYSQITAMFINSVHFLLVLTTISSFTLSMFIFLYLIRSMEKWHAANIIKPNLNDSFFQEPQLALVNSNKLIGIDLTPLLEVGVLEEKEKIQLLISSIRVMLSRNIGQDNIMHMSGHHIYISPTFDGDDEDKLDELLCRIQENLLSFQKLFALQYSIAGLPVFLVRDSNKEHNAMQTNLSDKILITEEHAA